MNHMNRILMRAAVSALALAAVPAGAADEELLVFDWSGYEDEGFFQSYLEKHGEAPSYAFFGNDDEAFQKLLAGFKADIGHPCAQMVERYRDAGLVEPWDTSRIDAYADINPDFLASDIFEDGTGTYFMPFDIGTTATLYRTDTVSEDEVQTLGVFLDPKYAGRISLPDNTDDIWALALLANGVSDWTQMTEEDFVKGADWLRQAHQNVRAYWQDGAELAQLVASGEVVLAWAWNETPTTLLAEGHPVAFEREPTEGSSAWFCGYVNLKDGPGSEDKTYDMINALMSPETANYIVSEWGYGHGNLTAMNAIDPQLIEERGLAQIEAPLLVQEPMDNAMRTRMAEEFEKIKAGF
jgi:spermidine/putrescine transport system substrate-binding protein